MIVLNWFEFVAIWIQILTSCSSSASDIARPAKITQQPPSKVVWYPGKASIRIKCYAKGTKPITYYWKKVFPNGSSEMINTKYFTSSDQGSNLYFMDITKTYKGYYQCFARNSFGTDMSILSELVFYFINRTESVLHRMKVNLGETAVLPCRPIVEQYPAPTFKWYWVYTNGLGDDEELSQSNRISWNPHNGTLYFAYTTVEDFSHFADRVLMCSQINEGLELSADLDQFMLLMDNRNSSHENTRQMMVYSPTANMNVVAGSTFRLQCIFVGRPTPVVKWTFKDRQPTHQVVANLRSSNELVGIDADSLHSGKYTCKGIDPLSQREIDRANVHVNVQYPPEFTSDKKPVDRKAVVGGSVFYECEASERTLQPVTTKWYINGEIISPFAKYEIGRTTLEIKDLTKEEIMLIQCSISNRLGFQVASGALLVFSPFTWVDGGTRHITERVYVNEDDGLLDISCDTTHDPGEYVVVTWCKDVNMEDCLNHNITEESPPLIAFNNNRSSLSIDIRGSVESGLRDEITGTYTCVVTALVHPTAYSNGGKIMACFTVKFYEESNGWAMPVGLLFVALAFAILFYLIGVKLNKCPPPSTIPAIIAQKVNLESSKKAAKQAQVLEKQLQKSLQGKNEYSTRIKLAKYQDLTKKRRIQTDNNLIELADEYIKQWDEGCTVDEVLLKTDFVKAIVSGKESKILTAMEKYNKLSSSSTKRMSFDKKFIQGAESILKQREVEKLQTKVRRLQMSLIKILKSNNVRKINERIEQCEAFEKENGGLVQVNKKLIKQSKLLVRKLESKQKYMEQRPDMFRKMSTISIDLDTIADYDDFVRENERLLEEVVSATERTKQEQQKEAAQEAKLRDELADALSRRDENAVKQSLDSYKEFGLFRKCKIEIDMDLLHRAQTFMDERTDASLREERDLKQELEEKLRTGETEEVREALGKYKDFEKRQGSDFSVDQTLMALAQDELEDEKRRVSIVPEEPHDMYPSAITSRATHAAPSAVEIEAMKLKTALSEALNRENEEDIEYALHNYKIFLAGQPGETISKRLITKANVALKLSKQKDVDHEEVAQMHESLRSNLLKAKSTGSLDDVVKALNAYEDFVSQNKTYVTVDDASVENTKEWIATMRHSEKDRLSQILLKAVNEYDEDSMRIALEDYQKFCAKHKENITLDSNLVERAEQILQDEEDDRLYEETILKGALGKSIATASIGEIQHNLTEYEEFAFENEGKCKVDEEMVIQAREILDSHRRATVKIQIQDVEAELRSNLVKAVEECNKQSIEEALMKYKEFGETNTDNIITDNDIIGQAEDTLTSFDKQRVEREQELKATLSRAIASMNDNDIKKALLEYEDFLLRHDGKIQRDESLIESARDTLMERKRLNKLLSEYGPPLENAIDARNAKELRHALDLYRTLDERVIDRNLCNRGQDVLRELETDADKRIQDIDCDLRQRVKTRRGFNTNEVLDLYKDECNKIGREPDETLVKKVTSIIRMHEEKIEGINQKHKLLRDELEKVGLRSNLEQAKAVVTNYEIFSENNLEFLTPDSGLLESAKDIVERLEEINKTMLDSLAEALKRSITEGDHSHTEKALHDYEAFLKKHDEIQTDVDLLRNAKKAIAQAKKDEQMPQEKAIDMQPPTKAIDEKVPKEKAIKTKSTGEAIDDETQPPRNEKLLEYDRRLKHKLKRAVKDNDRPILIQAMSDYGKLIEDAKAKPDEKLIKKCNKGLKILEGELTKEHERLKSQLSEYKHKDTEDLKESLTKYKRLCDKNNDMFTVDENLKSAVKTLIKDRKVSLKPEEGELEIVRLNLLKAIDQMEDPTMIADALSKYQKHIVKEHASDDDLIKKAQLVMKDLAMKAGKSVIAQHLELTENLKQVSDTGDIKEIYKALSGYDKFVKMNKTIIVGDKKLMASVKARIASVERKRKLRDVVDRKDTKELDQAIKDIESSKDVEALHNELKAAKEIRDSLAKLDELKGALLSIDREMLTQIRDQSNPPQIVHNVIIATLLTLGTHEDDSKDWERCKPLLSNVRTREYVGLMKRISEFKFRYLRPEIAARVMKIMQDYNDDNVSEASAGGALFYQWTTAMCKQCLSWVDEQPKGARDSKQRAVLDEMVKEMQTDLLEKK